MIHVLRHPHIRLRTPSLLQLKGGHAGLGGGRASKVGEPRRWASLGGDTHALTNIKSLIHLALDQPLTLTHS